MTNWGNFAGGPHPSTEGRVPHPFREAKGWGTHARNLSSVAQIRANENAAGEGARATSPKPTSVAQMWGRDLLK